MDRFKHFDIKARIVSKLKTDEKNTVVNRACDSLIWRVT